MYTHTHLYTYMYFSNMRWSGCRYINICIHMYISIRIHTLIEGNPPPGGVSYSLCSLIKNREYEGPPRSTWYKSFDGGPPTHGS